MKIKEAKSLPQMIDDTRPILDAVNNAMTNLFQTERLLGLKTMKSGW